MPTPRNKMVVCNLCDGTGLIEPVPGLNQVPAPPTDSERLAWLLRRGLAWRDCYDHIWKEGEWLYATHDGYDEIDDAMKKE